MEVDAVEAVSFVARTTRILELAGHEVRVTSPGKVFFAERGETKCDLVEHYLRVGEPLLRTDGRSAGAPAALPRRRRRTDLLPEARADNAPEWLQTTIVTTRNGTPSARW